jgi:DNA-binding NtrC family response regulator
LLAGDADIMKPSVLIIDDEQSMCDLLQTDLRLRDFAPCCVTSSKDAFEAFSRQEFEVVLTDLKMPGIDGIQLCSRLVEKRPDVPVVVMTAFGSLETAVAAIRAGAYDFVTKPIEMELLAMILSRAVERRRLQQQVRHLSETLRQSARFEELLGESAAMQKLYDQLSQVADSEATVLITGESGTGKELVAKALHQRCRRRAKPFVAVNCAALPDALLESELFGHFKGAFTDARAERKGLFLQAEGGTLLLDEIGEMPLSMQAKLLRALEENKVRPLGGEREVDFDVRILAATNRDLETAVEEGRFRQDLFFRVNVIQLAVPPLRSRGADTLLLAQHFVEIFAGRAQKRVAGISDAVAGKLLAYSWPGNVRELRNVVERAVALTRHDKLTSDDLPEKIRDFRGSQVVISGNDPGELTTLEEVERRYILHVIECLGDNRTLAARTLGLDRKTLYRKLRQYGILRENAD